MLQGGNIARCVAIRDRDIRVSDRLPSVAEGRQRRPTVCALSPLARKQWCADAGATPQTLQAPHLQGSEDVPQVP